jgi:hypothetical protein
LTAASRFVTGGNLVKTRLCQEVPIPCAGGVNGFKLKRTLRADVAIKIVEEPDVVLTADEAQRYRYDYSRAYSYYAGPVPTFESYCRRRKAEDSTKCADC